MLKKFKNLIALFVLGFSLLVPTVASAETQSGTVRRLGLDITYSLKCSFSLTGADKATAVTSWDGKAGYSMKVKLYHCQSVSDSYHSLGKSLDATYAQMTASIAGVWTYRSKHYLHTNSNGSTEYENDLLTTFTDW